MNTEPVILERRGPVAWLTLNRPEAMNAISTGMRLRLVELLDEIEGDPTLKVIVVTGAGRAFCAGGDLSEFKARLESGESAKLVEIIRQAGALLARFESTSLPVIAAVNGVAVAGGLELLLCCDIVLAARTAKIGDGHLKYGVIPGGGGAIRLPRKIPANIAKYLLLTGELVSAEVMAQWGLVNEILEPDALDVRAEALANQIATLSPLGLATVKKLANDAPDASVEIGVAAEVKAFGSYVTSEDFLEGMKAFAEKRGPVFTGK